VTGSAPPGTHALFVIPATCFFVIPAQAGTQCHTLVVTMRLWVPACAGMTDGVAGMTGGVAGMTGGVAGMTGGVAGMTDGVAGMTDGVARTADAEDGGPAAAY